MGWTFSVNTYQNFVSNLFVDEDVSSLHSVIDPSTGEPVANVPLASLALVTIAVKAAQQAHTAWRRLPGIERAQGLQRLADALLAQCDTIGAALALESGKSLADACAEVGYGADIVRYHAEWARRIEGEIIPSDNAREQLFLHRESIGVVACLIPFNFPIYTLLRKIAPALIAGNTVVVRPSNTTPSSALALARAVQAAQLPDGVVNIMAMDHEVCAAMCQMPGVGMITLTGSVSAGRQIMAYAQTNIAKTSLELGGKTPAIVAADADLDLAAQAIVNSRLTHCGQLCTAVERVLVERSVHDALLQRIKSLMAKRSWGNRRDDDEHMGPQASEKARQNVHAMVQKAVAQGATLELGGFMPDGPGFYYPPTLLSGCQQDMEIIQEEVFGPVLAVMACDDMAHALACANDHQYGLASVLFTHHHPTVRLFANEIEAGELYVNRTPADPYQGFHAGWKRSGLGGDDGKHGMLEFTQTRLVVMPY
jgi:lactaldehyde dehydrogenase/glycolaldehyde dehydrogenase